jgi:hypothetical protein
LNLPTRYGPTTDSKSDQDAALLLDLIRLRSRPPSIVPESRPQVGHDIPRTECGGSGSIVDPYTTALTTDVKEWRRDVKNYSGVR